MITPLPELKANDVFDLVVDGVYNPSESNALTLLSVYTQCNE